jgi:GNAT superfamily N-acetyltransferase
MEKPYFESQEEIIITKTLHTKELLERVYKGERLPADKRLASDKSGGVFKYFDLGNLDSYGEENRFYPIVEKNKEIIGLAELEKNPEQKEMLWIKFLSVDPKYQGKGYGKKLAEEIFQFAKLNGYFLYGSIYSDEGRKKLKNLFSTLSEKYSVDFIDPENRKFLRVDE